MKEYAMKKATHKAHEVCMGCGQPSYTAFCDGCAPPRVAVNGRPAGDAEICAVLLGTKARVKLLPGMPQLAS
jgi:hypothetical protein